MLVCKSCISVIDKLEINSSDSHKSIEGSYIANFFAVCPKCGAKWPHQAGKPCYGIICPECGSQMTRE